MKGRPLARRILWLVSATSLLAAVVLAVTGLASVPERAAQAEGAVSESALRAEVMLLPFLLLGIGIFAAILAGVALHEPDRPR